MQHASCAHYHLKGLSHDNTVSLSLDPHFDEKRREYHFIPPPNRNQMLSSLGRWDGLHLEKWPKMQSKENENKSTFWTLLFMRAQDTSVCTQRWGQNADQTAWKHNIPECHLIHHEVEWKIFYVFPFFLLISCAWSDSEGKNKQKINPTITCTKAH